MFLFASENLQKGTMPCLKHRTWKPSSTTAVVSKLQIWTISASSSSPFHPLQTIKNQKARADVAWKQQLRQHCRQDPVPRHRICCCWRQKDGSERLLSSRVTDRQQTPAAQDSLLQLRLHTNKCPSEFNLGNDFLSGAEQDGNVRGLLSWFQELDFSCSPALSWGKSCSPSQCCASTCSPQSQRWETALRYHHAENGKSFSVTPMLPPWEFKKQAKYNKETFSVMFNRNAVMF